MGVITEVYCFWTDGRPATDGYRRAPPAAPEAQLLFLLLPLFLLLVLLFKEVLQLRLLLDGALHFYQVFTVDRRQPAGVGKT